MHISMIRAWVHKMLSYTFRVIIVMKKRSVTSDGIQRKPETPGDPIRYASSVKSENTESAQLQTTNVAFSFQKEDYEEMNPNDHPIYEQSFWWKIDAYTSNVW